MQLAFIHPCPVCSKELSFTGQHTNIIVCRSCGSTINRTNEGTLLHQPQFTILHNEGIIQPGSTGTWQGKSFTVLGRFRAWYEESVFNYWTIRFDNEETAWLAEGYGIYSILKPLADPPELTYNEIRNINIGYLKDLDSPVRYILEKKYKAVKWEVEGELYIPNNVASVFGVLEFSNACGKNITYFEFLNENVLAFEVTYIHFEDLKLQNLRTYTYKGKIFTCASCKATVLVSTYPYAQCCACTSCGMQYAMEHGGDFRKGKGGATSETIYLPIGSLGKLKGINYEVIGYVQKEEVNTYHSKWREYTLYNPQEGFAFLSEYDGHWIYLREHCNSPVLLNSNDRTFYLDNEPFQLFNSYNYKILNAKGEFPYNIFDNRDTKAKEFISPPEIWIQEKNKQEGITWYFGRHVSSKEIAQSFGLTAMPYRKGVGAVQPVGYISRVKIILATLLGIFVLVMLHTFINLDKQKRPLFNQTFSFPDTADQVSVVTEKFVLDKHSSNIRFDIEAPVSNSWVELSAVLVNAQTGKEYNVEKGVEFYYGWSDGESWTEGSTKGNAYLKRIPAGTYFLQLLGTRENGFSKIGHFYLDIIYDVPSHRNLWWSLFLFLLGPVIKYIYIGYKEKARWSNSPYSTYE